MVDADTLRVVIWGAAGHARVVADILTLNANMEIVGFLDDVNKNRHGETFCGAPVLSGLEQLKTLTIDNVKHTIIAIGDCSARRDLAEHAKNQGFSLISAIHPSAILAGDVTVSSGTVIAAGSIINPASYIGENAIINTSASIDHNCNIGDYTHIAPRVCLAGYVTVGTGSSIGIGSSVKDNVRIGNNCQLGAGSVVISDIPDNSLAYGVPARIIKTIS